MPAFTENQDDVDVAEQNGITFEYEELKGYFKALSLTCPALTRGPLPTRVDHYVAAC